MKVDKSLEQSFNWQSMGMLSAPGSLELRTLVCDVAVKSSMKSHAVVCVVCTDLGGQFMSM